MFLISYIQYMIIAIVFSNSKPFKKSIITNYLLCFFLFISLFFAYYLILESNAFLNDLFSVKITYLLFYS